MKYQVKFIEKVEGRDTIIQGGVSFPIGKAITIDSEKVEMAPWFIGNRSFIVEEMTDETTEDQHDDASENRSDSSGSEDLDQDAEKQADEVKPVPKRARKKVASK